VSRWFGRGRVATEVVAVPRPIVVTSGRRGIRMIRGAASEALVPVPIIAGALFSGGRARGAGGPTIGKAAGPGRIPEFVIFARRGAATVVIIIPVIAVAASRRGRRGLARNTAPLIRMPVPTRTVVGASLLVRR
jgi:hypothetical protein